MITTQDLENLPAYRGVVASFNLQRVTGEDGAVALHIEGRTHVASSGLEETPRCVWRVNEAELRALIEAVSQPGIAPPTEKP